MVIFDTNIIIDHLRSPKHSIFWELSRELYLDEIGISVISVQELYGGQSTKLKKDEETMLSTISALKFLDYSYEIAELAGKIRRNRDTFIEFPDAAIAATCIANDAKLATLNQKHFKGIKDLKLAF